MIAACAAFVLFAAALVVATPAITSAQQPTPTQTTLSAAQVGAEVQKRSNATTTIDASFKQTITDVAFNKTTKKTGHVVFAKPGKMRWDYDDGSLMVSDGSTVWSYDPGLNQATKMSVGKTQLPVALGFLAGTTTLAASFTLSLVPVKGYVGYVLKGVPITPTTAVDFVLFYVDPTFALEGVTVVDSQGNKNRIELFQAKSPPAIKPSVFVWSPPTGAAVKIIP